METLERPHKIRKTSGISPTDADLRASATSNGNKSEEAQQHPIRSTASDANDIASDESVFGDSSECGNGLQEQLPLPEEVAPVAAYVSPIGGTISKSQMKKMKKKEEWEAKRGQRKAIRKERMIAKRQRRREECAEQAQRQSDRDQSAFTNWESLQPPQTQKPQNRVILPVTIVIDCDFDELMRDNERISLGAQVTRAYSDNRSSPYRAHLTVCSFGGKLRERFDGLLNGMYKSWRNTRFLDADFVATAEEARKWMAGDKGGELKGAFSKYANASPEEVERLKGEGEVVYLSSESDETLESLKPFSTYIIGGLVDKNREKGICHKRASKAGVKTAKLPIKEYMEMQSRKVLATNHVNEILLKWLETGDWAEAFFKVIPKRKGGKLKHPKNKGDATNEHEDVATDDPEDSRAAADASIDGPEQTQ